MNPPFPPETRRELAMLRDAGHHLFELGKCVITPGALAHLREHDTEAVTFLVAHQYGNWGELGANDAKANDEAVLHGGRILSAYDWHKVKLYVITDAIDDLGVRASTTILLAKEY